MASRPGPATRPLTIYSARLCVTTLSPYINSFLVQSFVQDFSLLRAFCPLPTPPSPFAWKIPICSSDCSLNVTSFRQPSLIYHHPPPPAGSDGFLGFPRLLLLPLTALITALYKSLFSSLSPRRASTVPDFFTMNSRYKHRAWHIVGGQKMLIELWLNPVASTPSQSPLRSSFFAHKSQPNSGWRILAGIRFPSHDCPPPDSFPC